LQLETSSENQIYYSCFQILSPRLQGTSEQIIVAFIYYKYLAALKKQEFESMIDSATSRETENQI